MTALPKKKEEEPLVIEGSIAISIKVYDELVAKAKAYEKLHNNLRDLRDSMLARLTALINASD